MFEGYPTGVSRISVAFLEEGPRSVCEGYPLRFFRHLQSTQYELPAERDSFLLSAGVDS